MKIDPLQGSHVAATARVTAQSHLGLADEHLRLTQLPQAPMRILGQVSDPEERPGRRLRFKRPMKILENPHDNQQKSTRKAGEALNEGD